MTPSHQLIRCHTIIHRCKVQPETSTPYRPAVYSQTFKVLCPFLIPLLYSTFGSKLECNFLRQAFLNHPNLNWAPNQHWTSRSVLFHYALITLCNCTFTCMFICLMATSLIRDWKFHEGRDVIFKKTLFLSKSIKLYSFLSPQFLSKAVKHMYFKGTPTRLNTWRRFIE